MPSERERGGRVREILQGPVRLAALAPDPLLSIQEQSPDASLCCLFTHQPPVVSARAYVYHNYRALQPLAARLSRAAPCPAAAQHAPNPDMARFLISSLLPPGCERNGISGCAPPFPISTATSTLTWVMMTVHALCIAISELPAVCPLLILSCKVYFTSFPLFVCDYFPQLHRGLRLPDITRLLMLVVLHFALSVAA